MRCKCGAFVSWRMQGECLACRYERIRNPEKEAANELEKKRIRVRLDIAKLPKPILPATKPYRGWGPEDFELKRIYEAAKRQRKMQRQLTEQAKQVKNGKKMFTPEEDAAIRRLSKEGKSLKEIAQKLGRPYASVAARKKKLVAEDSGFNRFLEGLL